MLRLRLRSTLSPLIKIRSFCIWYSSGNIGKWSLSRLPYNSFTGLNPNSLLGVFLYESSALASLSVSKFPSMPTFSLSNLLIVFTPSSALRLDLGCYADDNQWATLHLFKNSWVSIAVYSGPPLLASSSGAPWVTKWYLNALINPAALSAGYTDAQLVYRSTITTNVRSLCRRVEVQGMVKLHSSRNPCIFEIFSNISYSFQLFFNLWLISLQ